jgi:hypothetical protein
MPLPIPQSPHSFFFSLMLETGTAYPSLLRFETPSLLSAGAEGIPVAAIPFLA